MQCISHSGLVRVGVLLATALAWGGVTQAREAPVDLDFESGKIGQVPTGWFVPRGLAEAGAQAIVTAEGAKEGTRCARLTGSTRRSTTLCNLMQSFAAETYRERRVRLRAAVRVDSSSGRAQVQMWLREDRPGGQGGLIDNMVARPITDSDWAYYEIVGDISADAETLNIGFMLFGDGPAWVDDVTLEVVGEAAKPEVNVAPLTDRALENLVAFTRLLGYVRYFHPSDEAARVNWDFFATRGVYTVESAASPEELAERLTGLFAPIAPTIVVQVGTKRPAAPASAPTPPGDRLRITYWRHVGVAPETTRGPSPYSSTRVVAESTVERPSGVADPNEAFFADLGGGVSCLVPLTLYVNDQGTWPRATAVPGSQPATREAELPLPTGTARLGRAGRLALVMVVWNIMQHFYPYFDDVQTDWPASLRTTLKRAATDVDDPAFLKTLRLLIADLKDGHGNVWHCCDTATARLPLAWDWVENRLVVTAVVPEDEAKADDIRPGDVVVKVDGIPAAEALADVERYISAATPQWRRWCGLQALARGAPDTKVKLELRRDAGKTRAVTLSCKERAESVEESRPEQIAELQAGIMYVDIGRVKDEDFIAALPKLEQARGIVFDLRGYPVGSTIAISHLIDKPVRSPRWNIPVVLRPDREGVTYQLSGWPVMPVAPKFTAKIAFLTDGRAISYAETYLGIISHYQLAAIVGSPTAGTNGNINPFALPGGYTVCWTGMKVLTQDGERHHGVGIQPTVPAARTLAGVAAGRDEVLERAVEWVQSEGR